MSAVTAAPTAEGIEKALDEICECHDELARGISLLTMLRVAAGHDPSDHRAEFETSLVIAEEFLQGVQKRMEHALTKVGRAAGCDE